MKKRYLVLGLLALIILGVFTGRVVKAHMDYVRELDEFRARELEIWVVTQRGVASSLDRVVAEVLVSPPERLQSALGDALQQAYRAREANWRTNIPYSLYVANDRWGYRHVYQNIAAYFEYLVGNDTVHLSVVEQENVKLVRAYADTLYDGFSALMPHIRYQTTTRSGQNTFRYYPWRTLIDNQDMVSILNTLGNEINLLPDVGSNDSGFRVSIAQRDQSWQPFRDYGLVYSGERVYSREEMLAQAIEYVETFAVGSVVDFMSPEVRAASGRTSLSYSSGGSSSDIGNHTGFVVQDTETEWVYNISVTEVGGHINYVAVSEKSSNIGSMDDILQMADTLISQWAKFEGVLLELERLDEAGDHITMTYAVMEEGVMHIDKIIQVTVPLPVFPDTSHEAIHIDAGRYFWRYNAPVPGKASLTPEEAVKLLSPTVTATSKPRLELHNERLVYAIPVTGVDRVTRIHIDAITGEYVRMEYDYAR